MSSLLPSHVFEAELLGLCGGPSSLLAIEEPALEGRTSLAEGSDDRAESMLVEVGRRTCHSLDQLALADLDGMVRRFERTPESPPPSWPS